MRATGLLFALALTLVAVLVYGFYLRGNLPVGADNTLFYAPFYALRWQGGPPLWNPFSLSGTSLVDNLQAALLYPPRWPFFFVSDWRDYFGPFVFLHYLVAFFGMAGLLRALGTARLAALGGAIVFAAGGHLAGRIINPTIFQASCWLPWLLWGAAGPRPRHAALTLLAAAMIFTIGSPHLIFYGTLAWGLFFPIVTLIPAWKMRNAECGMRNEENSYTKNHEEHTKDHEDHYINSAIRNPHSAFMQLAALVLAFVLAAPTLLPGVLRAQSSIRTHSTVEANLADSASYGELLPILLGGTGAAIYPEYIDKCCYVGPVALALAVWLALRRRSWRDPRFLGALALTILGLFFALGKNAGLQFILPYLPIVRNLAGASRALVLTAAGLAILTALALDALAGRPSRGLGFCQTRTDTDGHGQNSRPTRALGIGLLGAALGAGAAYLFAVRGQVGDSETAEVALQLVRAWACGPSSVGWPFYALIDAAFALAAAGLILLLPVRLGLPRDGLLCALLLAMLWHFEPRVHPPTERRAFFEPPPPVAFLQAERDRAPQAPFRVAGYDPLRLHDTEFDSPFKFHFLMPNMATLFRLEDINGFDPLILVNYLNLFLETSGRAPHNDPIRNLDIARPDPRLFDLLGVRFLAGHPYDRRLTTIPLTLTPERPTAEAAEWNAERAEGPVTHWLFVGLLDRALNVPLDAEVARLRVEADEGAFEFPIRNGREVAEIHALNFPPLLRKEGFRATLNKAWSTNVPAPQMDYRIRLANYRGAVAFGRPLRVRRAAWRLVESNIVFNIAGQAYRLAAPPPDRDPWVLRFGTPDDVAPIYEYRHAKPRAVLAGNLQKGQTRTDTEGSEVDIKMNEADLDTDPPAGAIEWLERGDHTMKLRVRAERPSVLVLREIWDPGWRAEVGGARAPILRVNGLLRAVRLPAGPSDLVLVYRPRLPMALLAVAALGLILITIVIVFVFAKSRKKICFVAPRPSLF